jgi:hypothetical protein
MNAAEFRSVVLNEFPELERDFVDWSDDLLHLQMMEFLVFTQNAIKQLSFDTVTKCFTIANAALKDGDAALRNAVYVSFLENLDLSGDDGRQAAEIMPSDLRVGRDKILDYAQELLGRKLPTDNR